MMRSRDRILDSLEAAYREGLRRAEEQGDAREAARLELDFVRDQLQLEVLLDLRELLTTTDVEDPRSGSGVGDILDTARKLRNLTRLR